MCHKATNSIDVQSAEILILTFTMDGSNFVSAVMCALSVGSSAADVVVRPAVWVEQSVASVQPITQRGVSYWWMSDAPIRRAGLNTRYGS